MIISLDKDTSKKKKIKPISKKVKATSIKKIESFFGKLPNIENGLKFQKAVRNEWE